MHILKDSTTGLLFSPFALGPHWYLQVAILQYFALDDPATPLSEQKLWPECLPLLGEQGLLDPGFPKVRGEVLLAGSWHAPDKSPAPGGAVRFAVGPIERTLAVFGPRFWQAGPAGAAPSRPEPVLSVPLTWQTAFGGSSYAANPQGAGLEALRTPWGELRQALPQVEDPRLGLVTSPADRPRPACPLPVPADAPERLALAGTYDERWLKNFWPGFPPDLNPAYFSLAQEEQRLPEDYGSSTAAESGAVPGYFLGGEPITLEHLHPDKPFITSRLPSKRVRVFASRIRDPKTYGRSDTAPRQELFEEYTCRFETVWLFPAIERGVGLWRAVLPVQDDEFSDVVRLFAVVEDARAPRTDIRFWQAEQTRRLSEARVQEPQPFSAGEVLEKSRASLRTLEEDLNLALDQATGRAAVLPVQGVQQFARAKERLNRALAIIDEAEQRLIAMHREFGHRVKIDTRSLEPLKARLTSLLPELDKAARNMGRLDKIVAAAQKKTQKMLEKAREDWGHLPTREMREEAAKHPLNLDMPEPSPEERWSTRALQLLADHALLESTDPAAMQLVQALLAAGLREGDVLNARLAYLSEDCPIHPEEFGLDLQDERLVPFGDELAQKGTLAMPRGLVLPFFAGARCIALYVLPAGCARTNDPDRTGQAAQSDLQALPADLFMDLTAAAAPDTLWTMPGSRHGLQLLGAIRPKPVLLCTSPLEAWLCYALAGDLCALAIAQSPQAGEVADEDRGVLARAEQIFWPVPPLPETLCPAGLAPVSHTFSAAKQAQRKAVLAAVWQPLCGKPCEPLPWPADQAVPTLWHAREQGLDVRSWLVRELRQRGVPLPDQTVPGPSDNKNPVAVPEVDVAGIVARLKQRAKAIADGKRAEFTAAADEARARVQKELSALKKPFCDLVLPPVPAATLDEALDMKLPELPDPDVLKNLDKTERLLQEKKPGDVPKIQSLRESYLKAVGKMQALDAVSRERILADRALFARAASGPLLPDPLPDWVKTLPGGGPALKPPKVPDVPGLIGRLRSGARGLTLRKVDFSGQDLSGCVFRECFLEEVNLAKANLSRTVWDKAMATKICLDGADLSHASITMSSFTEASLAGTRAHGLQMELAQWKESSIQDVDLTRASCKLCGFTNTDWQGTVREVHMELCTFTQCPLKGLTLQQCSLNKCTLASCALKGVRVEGGHWQETGFVTCTGSELALVDCEATNLRFLVNCEIERLRCMHCVLDDLCAREVRLPGAVFWDCRLSNACLDRCDLPRALIVHCQADGAQLRHCDLEGADLHGSSLATGSLRRSRLVEASLEDCNLYGAEVYKAVLGKTALAGSNLERSLLEGQEDLLRRMEMSK